MMNILYIVFMMVLGAMSGQNVALSQRRLMKPLVLSGKNLTLAHWKTCLAKFLQNSINIPIHTINCGFQLK